MSDPVGLIGGSGGVNPLMPKRADAGGAAQGGAAGGASFKDTLMQNLERVNELQSDATRAVEDYQTGRRTDLEGVILATEKADTAFQMLQSVRNKVIQAYEDLQQMRT